MRSVLLALFLIFAFMGMVTAQVVEETELVSHLLESVINRDLHGVDRAIQDGENIDLTNPNGWSAARFAVSGNDLGMVNHLVAAGIDLNNADNQGVTPLMVAAAAVSIPTWS
jgi:ankyrin repeat protein